MRGSHVYNSHIFVKRQTKQVPVMVRMTVGQKKTAEASARLMGIPLSRYIRFRCGIEPIFKQCGHEIVEECDCEVSR